MANESDSSLSSLAFNSFVAGNYDEALETYDKALLEDPKDPDLLCGRAHTLIKLERYEKAKIDAISAIKLPNLTPTQRNVAFMRSGLASFHLGNYSEAEKCFLQAKELFDEVGVRQWIVWCNEKLIKSGIRSNRAEKSQAEEVTAIDSLSITSPSQQQAVIQTPAQIKFDWYQTQTSVVIEIRLKNAQKEDLSIEYDDTTLFVSYKLSSDQDYILKLNLFEQIIPQKCTHEIHPSKIEIKLYKESDVRWTSLESIEVVEVSSKTKSLSSIDYPTSSGKKWNKIMVDIESDLAKDKPEGEAALNEMFQKIYGDGNDDVRKAMNKSFQESGGTVLSTNWNDIKKERVEVKPPEGMEYKSWN